MLIAFRMEPGLLRDRPPAHGNGSLQEPFADWVDGGFARVGEDGDGDSVIGREGDPSAAVVSSTFLQHAGPKIAATADLGTATTLKRGVRTEDQFALTRGKHGRLQICATW